MATTIKLKNSVTTTNAPSSLAQGEVAINITDKKVWVGNAATTPIQLLGAGSSASFGALTCTSLTNSGLTSGRVTYASTGGLLTDSANLTFNGTTLTVADLTDSSLTANRVVYATTAGNLTTSANLTFNGTTLTTANDASISGLTVGKGGGAVATNTAVGVNALVATTGSSSNNSAFGSAAGSAFTSGSRNTALGFNALLLNTTGNENTAVGGNSLNKSTTPSGNTAVGYVALYENTTGGSNVAVGASALQNNTTASYATAVGYQAGYSNTTGLVTAFGFQAAYSNTTGINNTAIGTNTLNVNTTGANNVAVGTQALQANTTASNNTAVGYQAGYSNSTSASNTFIGHTAGYSTTSTRNVFVGQGSGYWVSSGAKNVILGNFDGNQGGIDIRTSSNNIVLSDGDGNPRIYITSSGNTIINGAGIPNGTVYGGSAFQSAGDGRMQLIQATTSTGTRALQEFYNPNGNVGSIGTSGSNAYYSTTSDYRLKENIAPMTGALATVAKLKPCTYTWKASNENSQGFIAHELAEICPQAVIGEKDAVDAEGNPQYQGVDTSFLVATLTAAIQELKQEVDSLKAQLNNGA